MLVLRTSLSLAKVACEKCTPGLFSFFIWLVVQITGLYEVIEAPQTAVTRWIVTHVSAGGATAGASLQVGQPGEHEGTSSWVHIV